MGRPINADNPLTIYLDFDGTVVEHAYPIIGAPNPGAIDVIGALQQNGHKIVLNTLRADLNDGSLEEAMAYLNSDEHGMDEIIHFELKKLDPLAYPSGIKATFQHVFIDDTSRNVPLRPNIFLPVGMMVDWRIVKADFLRYGLIKVH